jgi:6-phosphogluconolactonase (cycloisomerase 2 family)
VGTATDKIFSANVDLSSGALLEQGSVSLTAGSQPNGLAVTPDHKFMYVSYYGSSKIALFSLDSSTGVPTYVNEYLTLPSLKFVMDPLGRFLFVLQNVQIVCFTINSTTGAINLTGGVNIASGGSGIAVDSTGRFLFKGSQSSGINAYTIDPMFGSLTAIGTTWGAPGSAFRLNPANNRLFAAKPGGDTLNFAVNTTSGLLTFTDFQPVSATSPFSYDDFIFNAAGTTMYALKGFDGRIEAYTVNSSTGNLTALNSVNLPSGCSPKSLALLANEKFIYTGCTDSSGKAVGYAINADTSLGSATATSTVSGMSVNDNLLVAY